MAENETWPDELADAIGELGGEGTVHLYRVEGGNRVFVTTMDSGTFSLEAVQRELGPGRYQARIKAADGKWMKGGARTFSVAAPPAPARRTEEPPPWLSRVLDRIERLEERAAPAAAAGAAPDPLKLFADIGQIASAQTAQTVALIQALIPVMQGKGGGGIGPRAMLELIRTGAELSGRSGEAEGAAGVLERVGGRVLGLIERAEGRQEQPGGWGLPALPAPGTNGTEGEEPTVPIVVPAKESPFSEVAPHLPRLLKLADGGADVAMWAVAFDASFPRATDVVAALTDQLGHDVVMRELAATFPDHIKPETARWMWFDALLRALENLTQPEVSDGDDAE